MFGWELPPLISGGLGAACSGLLKALKQEGVEVVFVVPRVIHGLGYDFANVVGALGSIQADEPAQYSIVTSLQPYASDLYGSDILEEVNRFGKAAIQIGQRQDFDIVHAHDWTTYRAGVLVKQALGKPLLAHVHSIEHDRAPQIPNPQICALEGEGLRVADQVIAVSRYTKQRIVENYGIKPDRVKVIHNGIDKDISARFNPGENRPKIVLFVGRLTAQKGPQYFLLAAKRALESDTNMRFVIAGDGDMRCHLEKMAVELGIAERVLFTGFLSQFDLDRIYTLASVCVVTSVSEPFGLVALEAMKHGVPVILPRHAGVAEVVRNCLRVDYWDIDGIADGIIAVVSDRNSLAQELSRNAAQEVTKLTWNRAARKLIRIYHGLSAQRAIPRAARC